MMATERRLQLFKDLDEVSLMLSQMSTHVARIADGIRGHTAAVPSVASTEQQPNSASLPCGHHSKGLHCSVSRKHDCGDKPCLITRQA
jgi:hypothetical protein